VLAFVILLECALDVDEDVLTAPLEFLAAAAGTGRVGVASHKVTLEAQGVPERCNQSFRRIASPPPDGKHSGRPPREDAPPEEGQTAPVVWPRLGPLGTEAPARLDRARLAPLGQAGRGRQENRLTHRRSLSFSPPCRAGRSSG